MNWNWVTSSTNSRGTGLSGHPDRLGGRNRPGHSWGANEALANRPGLGASQEPQVVEVAVGDAGQAFEPAVAKAMVGCAWPARTRCRGAGRARPMSLV